jgi:hypothetical protein
VEENPNEALISVDEGRALIRAALAPLADMPVWNLGFVAGMFRIGFGSPSLTEVTWGQTKGQLQTVYEYHLHLQSPWRLISDGKPVLRSGKDVEPSTKTGRTSDRAVAIARKVLGSGVNRVSSATPEGEGGAVIVLDSSAKLRIYDPINAEWRIFAPDGTPHFVVERSGDGEPHRPLRIGGSVVSATEA